MTAESSLPLQQYLQQLIRTNPSDVKKLIEKPPNFEAMCWVYEHLRQSSIELGYLLVLLHQVCNKTNCPKMIATQKFSFLCAAHQQQNQDCCAMDYMMHTLDWTITLLNSEKHFPNRTDIKQSDSATFSNISRRIYRIFAHAYFHHREVFDQFEEETHSTERFTLLCNTYSLMPKEQQLIPENIFANSNN